MQTAVFVLYLLFLCWLITLIPFFRKSGLGKWILISLFLLKIAAGFGYAWYYSQPPNIATSDTWKYYRTSLTETAWLLRDPQGFIKDLFYSPYAQSGNLFSGVSSYWNDLKDNVFIKLMAVINVFTGKDYYTNLLIYNFFYLFGPVAFVRLVSPGWQHKKWMLLLPLLLPSFLFWCSGLHKDGLIFSAMLLLIYHCHTWLTERKITVKQGFVFLLCCLLLFTLRNVILFLLLPALAGYAVSYRYPRFAFLIFGGLYALGGLLFFAVPYFSSLDFPQYIINKQAEFNGLTGNSRINLPPLQPDLTSFLAFFPYALDLVFLRPHPADGLGFSYLLALSENILLLLSMCLWLFFHKPLKSISPLWSAILFFSLSVLLLCGYTVPFTGAIVRYKSIVTPLLAAFVWMTLDIDRIKVVVQGIVAKRKA